MAKLTQRRIRLSRRDWDKAGQLASLILDEKQPEMTVTWSDSARAAVAPPAEAALAAPSWADIAQAHAQVVNDLPAKE